MIRAADQVVEIGPGAGRNGGKIVFQGTPADMEATVAEQPDRRLSRRPSRSVDVPSLRRKPEHGWIRLAGARGNNLQEHHGRVSARRALRRHGRQRLGQEHARARHALSGACADGCRSKPTAPAPFDDVFGDGQLDDVVLVDQSPIGRSPRSNPVTYVKAFDEIRAVFADTVEARTRNYTAGYFSFNVDGGRCERCEGDGFLEVDMQFLADVFMKCPECRGRRYRKEILDVTYRNASIADVLDMTVREAFTFFRGSTKVQAKLKKLMDVGLDYRATRSAGQHAERRRIATFEARRLHGLGAQGAGAVHSRRADLRACTSPTSCS